MDDLTVQYGESEVLHLMDLKELSDKYEAKNHEEALARDDNDDAYADMQQYRRSSQSSMWRRRRSEHLNALISKGKIRDRDFEKRNLRFLRSYEDLF